MGDYEFRRLEDLNRVRNALFGQEIHRLEALEKRIACYDSRLLSDADLTATVANILADAFKLTETQDRKRVAAAISPLIIDTVRTEIRNSKDDIVEALYPLAGKLVTAYVSENFSKLLSGTDRRLRSWFSPLRFWLLLKAFLTGTSYRKLKLIHEHGIKLEQILIVKRGLGKIVDQWSAKESDSKDRSRHDQRVASMLSAINDFANETLVSDHGSLRTLDLGGSHLHLRATPSHILAIQCSGPSGGLLSRQIDRAIFPLLKQLSQKEKETTAGAAPIEIATSFAKQLETAILTMPLEHVRRPVFAYAFLGIGGAFCLASIGNIAAKGVQDHITGRRVGEVIASATTPGKNSSHVLFNVSDGGQSIRISGFISSQLEAENLLKNVKAIAPEAIIKNDLLVIAATPVGDILQTTQTLGNGVTTIATNTLQSVDDIVKRLVTLEQKVANGLVNTLSNTVPPLSPLLQTTNKVLQTTLDAGQKTIHTTLSASQSLIRHPVYDGVIKKLPQDTPLKTPIDDNFIRSAVADLQKTLDIKTVPKVFTPSSVSHSPAPVLTIPWDGLGQKPLLPELDAIFTGDSVHVGVVSIDGKTGRITGGTASTLFGIGGPVTETATGALENTSAALGKTVSGVSSAVSQTTNTVGSVVDTTARGLGSVVGSATDGLSGAPVVGTATGIVSNTLQGSTVPNLTSSLTGTVNETLNSPILSKTTSGVSNTLSGVGKAGSAVTGKVLNRQ